jgi:pimeloyl-ACP methyl ester carboxylesterase
MRFWRSPIGAMVVILLLGVSVALGATAVRVHRQLTPPRVQGTPIDFEAMMMRVEEVRFDASDGVALSGWFIPGLPDRPALILCHDLGSSRASLVNLAIALRRAGFSVFAFDFRGHGASEGGRSTLGLHEKRDVFGALEYLKTRKEIETRRVGVYGVGMGAHAVVLAAADRPALKVLVLDGLYPDAGYPLVHGVYRDWEFGVDHLGFLPRGVYMAFNGTTVGVEQASEVIGELLGRDMLLVASEADERLAGEMMRMYETVPEQIDADGNLVVLPAAHGDGLFAEQLESYHLRVTEFFESRMAE